MSIVTVPTKPFEGQRPGTSGVRKKVDVFRQPGYLENFVQSVFDVARGGYRRADAGASAATAAYYNRPRPSRLVLRMAAANGFGRVLVGARRHPVHARGLRA
ncbi:MAG: hypothetical protein MZW92_43275 [Comamonadaceae bacterium]|nr:hypothetical protein [Comamonadaceae bacterium]